MKLNVFSSEPELSVMEDESRGVTMRTTQQQPFCSLLRTNLQNSSMTASTPTETGSISEDDSTVHSGHGGGWLGGITADFKTLASTLKETAGGVANFVQRSALAVASEIANLEAEEEMAHHQQQQRQHVYDENVVLHLPWEIQYSGANGGGGGGESMDDEIRYEEDEILKEKIQALSTKEDTFLRPYSAKDVSDEDDDHDQHHHHHDHNQNNVLARPPFVLDEPRIQLVRRILKLDEKLAAMHAKLSGRSDVKEAVFWQNYFFNCEMAREEYLVLLDPPITVARMESFATDDDDGEDEGDDNNDKNEPMVEEEGSFVHIPSPPVSQRSMGSLVVIHPEILEMP